MRKCKESPAWIITFSDLMSLLLVFFVLLFVMSKTDTNKFKQMIESIQMSLTGSSSQQVQINHITTSSLDLGSLPETGNAVIPDLQTSLTQHFSEVIEQHLLNIQRNKEDITLTFPEKMTFSPGSSELSDMFKQQLQSLSHYVTPPNFHIRVIGHTDNTPVTGGRFHNNWELSAARAAAVVQTLIDAKVIRADQAEAVGLADTKPISHDQSVKGLEKNRRVEIIIQSIKTDL